MRKKNHEHEHENEHEREEFKLISEIVKIRKALECVCHELKKFNDFVRFPKVFLISQIGENGKMGTINGVPQNGSGSFLATPLPAGTSVGSVVPTWSTSDTANTSLTPSADGLSCAVAVGAGLAPGASFQLSVSATSPDGTVVANGTAVVPVLPPVTPPSNFPTSFDIGQTA